ncbi:predicted protein [Verticillium alfalfae VaMs.102]|uniref:Predicted protein n=1 Tax=Verticillium alfalfae (strain VaMs.102 / ATCC MYA-4576 / FGSC 10136) TaxID=526221 RepID=C9SCK7_VERA1|nr:predicted protein [Verticillium alfalfae VaMs.102]EEY16822.1 predicted protein [Verticillium alfalfae VaMs.102]
MATFSIDEEHVFASISTGARKSPSARPGCPRSPPRFSPAVGGSVCQRTGGKRHETCQRCERPYEHHAKACRDDDEYHAGRGGEGGQASGLELELYSAAATKHKTRILTRLVVPVAATPPERQNQMPQPRQRRERCKKHVNVARVDLRRFDAGSLLPARRKNGEVEMAATARSFAGSGVGGRWLVRTTGRGGGDTRRRVGGAGCYPSQKLLQSVFHFRFAWPPLEQVLRCAAAPRFTIHGPKL